MKPLIAVSGMILAFSIHVCATTWFPADHVCPVCKEKNTYQEIGSYGGYIYQWPSKYQYVYWPLTDFPSVYTCIDCHYSVYMWDFDSIPEDKADTVRAFVKTVSLDKKYDDYLDIPMTTRLEIAEKIYQILGRDKEFWCRFYRVLGYHYDEDHEKTKALQSRAKALDLAFEMVTDSAYAGKEKENLFIIAAMYNYMDQKDSAMLYLDKAGSYTYKNSAWKEENSAGLDKYLTDLIVQYREFINKDDE